MIRNTHTFVNEIICKRIWKLRPLLYNSSFPTRIVIKSLYKKSSEDITLLVQGESDVRLRRIGVHIWHIMMSFYLFYSSSLGLGFLCHLDTLMYCKWPEGFWLTGILWWNFCWNNFDRSISGELAGLSVQELPVFLPPPQDHGLSKLCTRPNIVQLVHAWLQVSRGVCGCINVYRLLF